jgi:hypothetical protein
MPSIFMSTERTFQVTRRASHMSHCTSLLLIALVAVAAATSVCEQRCYDYFYSELITNAPNCSITALTSALPRLTAYFSRRPVVPAYLTRPTPECCAGHSAHLCPPIANITYGCQFVSNASLAVFYEPALVYSCSNRCMTIPCGAVILAEGTIHAVPWRECSTALTGSSEYTCRLTIDLPAICAERCAYDADFQCTGCTNCTMYCQ